MKKCTLFIVACFTGILIPYAQNVGIGTATPRAKLEVNAPTANPALFNGVSPMYMSIYEDNIYRGYWGSYSGAPADVDFGTGVGSSGKLHLTTGASPKLTITSTGDVGVGTTVPEARFDIRAGGVNTSAFMIKNSSGDTVMRVRDNGYIGIGYNGNTYGRPLNIQGSGLNFYTSTSDYGGSIFPSSSGSMVLWSPSENVTLQPIAGSVTIGTYTAATGYKLAVDGKVIFEEARVQLSTSWPDYVFADDYKLQSLSDLEKSIAKNKHLPNMPPAAEVEKNGFDLGDMNRRLVEKVEELTLYIIQLKKENTSLEQRVKAIEDAGVK